MALFPNTTAKYPSFYKTLLSGKQKYWFLLSLGSLGMLLFLISYLGVDVPFWDEWDAHCLYVYDQKVNGFSFADAWRQHNEHRLFLPKLIFYVFSHDQIQIKPLLYFSHIIFWISSLFVLYLILINKDTFKKNAWYMVLFYATLYSFYFSFIQWENLLISFQIQIYLEVFGSILCVYGIVQRKYLWAGIGFLMAYLSFANWLTLIPVILIVYIVNMVNSESRKEKNKNLWQLIVFIILISLMLILYFLDYHSWEGHPSVFYFLEDPLTFVLHFFAFLGGAFSGFGGDNPIVYGVIFFISFLFLFFTGRFTKYSLCFYLILWVFSTDMMISLGRSGFGYQVGFSSRYTTFTIIGWIALLIVFFQTMPKWWKSIPILLLILGLVSGGLAVKQLGHRHIHLVKAFHCLKEYYEKNQPEKEDCLLLAYPDKNRLDSIVRKLMSKDMIDF